MYDQILFIDFDGTITSEETLEGAMRLCVDPARYREKAAEFLAGKCTLAETIRYAFAHIESARLPDILAYVRGVPVRPGFAELLDAMERMNMPVVVISGGMKPYVEEKLAPYRDKLLAVHSVEIDASGPFMELSSEAEVDGELMQKTLVMARYSYKRAICVGDSHTDARMALACDRVFARDGLARILERKGVPFTEWNDFYDVARAIEGAVQARRNVR